MQQAQPPSQASSAVWAPVSIPHSHRRALRARPPTANCGPGSEPVFCQWPAPLSSSVASPSIYAPVHFCSDSLLPASTAICVPMKRPCSHRRACKQPYVGPNPALYPVSGLHHWVHLLLAFPTGHLYSPNLTSNTGIFYHVPIVRIRKTTGTAWWIFKPLYLPVSALGPDPCCFPEIPPLHLCLQLSLTLCRHRQLVPTIKHGHTTQLPALGPSNWTWSHCWRTMLLFESLRTLCSACQGTHSHRWCGINQQVSMLPGPGVKNIIYIQCPTSLDTRSSMSPFIHEGFSFRKSLHNVWKSWWLL